MKSSAFRRWYVAITIPNNKLNPVTQLIAGYLTLRVRNGRLKLEIAGMLLLGNSCHPRGSLGAAGIPPLWHW